MRQLLLLRHAKSDWYSDAATDFERTLAERGKRDAPRIGRWLKQQGIEPDYIVSSPAKRARETVIAVGRELNVSAEHIQWESQIYLAKRSSLLEVLQACPAGKKLVLLVGHNPGLEELLLYLAGTQVQIPADGKVLPTAALVHLTMPDDWSALAPGCAKISSLIRPRSLPESI